MLAATPHMFPAPHNFLPKVPSPLSPRSANIYGRAQTAFMSNAENDKAAQNIPYSQRPVKKAPSPKQDELKERRRRLFLNKVSSGREEKRFEARGDDIMRLDFVQRQKQWEAELAREAPHPSFDSVDDDENQEEEVQEDLHASGNAMQISAPSTQEPWLEHEADEAMQREHAELEALLAYMSADDQVEAEMHASENIEHLYSDDDDDYDALFSELMEQTDPPSSSAVSTSQQQGEAMDTS